MKVMNGFGYGNLYRCTCSVQHAARLLPLLHNVLCNYLTACSYSLSFILKLHEQNLNSNDWINIYMPGCYCYCWKWLTILHLFFAYWSNILSHLISKIYTWQWKLDMETTEIQTTDNVDVKVFTVGFTSSHTIFGSMYYNGQIWVR